mgnify:CR=1 FL=1
MHLFLLSALTSRSIFDSKSVDILFVPDLFRDNLPLSDHN